MKLSTILLVCAFVFLVCFLVDTLIKVLFPKSKLEKSKNCVRPAKRSVTFGVLLTIVPVIVALKFGFSDTLLAIGCVVAFLLGILLLVTYFSVAIFYDDEMFLYKTLKGKKREFHYSQIKGQRSLMTRGGIQTILFVADEQIDLNSSMQNLNAFLSKAFRKWCEVKGIDADTVENNPRMFTWFPDPEKEAGGQ